VLGQVAAGQQAAVHLGVQGLDAAVQHLGELPVTSATSVTGRPFSASSLAVPPVDSSLMPSACRAWANSTMPVLSETERSAFMAMVEVKFE
jgi:hypothetical protein